MNVNTKMPLPGKELSFGRRIPFKGAVAIQMVGREIQKQPDVWPEGAGDVELKARQFQHHTVVAFGMQATVQKRGADIAAHKGPSARCFQEMPDQPGRRGLAIGTGNRNDRRLKTPGSQGQFAHDRNAPPPCRHDQRVLQRHAGRRRKQVQTIQKAAARTAKLADRAASLQKVQESGFRLDGRAHV